MTSSLRLAELLCARLCHEIGSPLGTLAGVLEILAQGGATAAEARDIADQAAASVRARLRLLRAAWAGSTGPMHASELRDLATGLRASRRISVELDELQGVFSDATAQLLLNLMLLGTESLGGAGILRMSGTEDDGITVELDGARAAWPEDFIAGLEDERVAWGRVTEAQKLQAPLTALLSQSLSEAGHVKVRVRQAMPPLPAIVLVQAL